MPKRSRQHLLAGVLLSAVLAACSDSRPDDQPAASGVERSASERSGFAFADLTDVAVDVTPRADEVVAAPAPGPREAVTAFVEAEATGQFARSFDLLSRDDRSVVRARSAWVNAHAYLPQLRSFDPITIDIGEDRAIARGTATFVPSLDEVRGLVAAEAALEVTAVPEDGGWRVAYQQSRLEPRYPPDATASDAVLKWAAQRQRCEPPSPDLQYATLVGSPTLADRLCHARGDIRVDPARRLGDRPDPTAVIAAFGAEADGWARSLAVRVADVRLHVAVAPIGDRWTVIGVLKA